MVYSRTWEGEVDHVGGITKVTIRPDIAGGMFFTDAEDMVCHLSRNYAESQDLKYVFKNINMERLIAARSENKQFKYNAINGAHAFQVTVFIPNFNFFKAAPYLCIHKDCKTDYGSCPLFKEYYHDVQKLHKTLLCSEMLSKVLPEETTGDEDDNNVLGFAQIDTVCAIPVDERSRDTVNFVKMIDHHINNSEDQVMADDWGQTIAPR